MGSVPLPWEQLLVLSLLGRDSSLELFLQAKGVADSITDDLDSTTTLPDITPQQIIISITPNNPRTTTPPIKAVTIIRERPWRSPRRSSPGSKGRSKISSTAALGSW